MDRRAEGRTLVLARHGQTNFNTEGRIQDPYTPHLTEVGRQQALALGRKVDSLGLTFDAIFCADTERTKETLAIMYPSYQTMSHVTIDPRLQERLHGDLVGKTKKDVEKELGEAIEGRLSYHLYFEGTDKSQLTKKHYPNNESLESVRKRLISLLETLKNKSAVLLIGSSIGNQYILEYLIHGTIGVQKPQLTNGEEIDFQTHDEVRVITIDENLKMKKLSSLKIDW